MWLHRKLMHFLAIISALEKMPESLITQHNIFERIANNTYHHYPGTYRRISNAG